MAVRLSKIDEEKTADQERVEDNPSWRNPVWYRIMCCHKFTAAWPQYGNDCGKGGLFNSLLYSAGSDFGYLFEEKVWAAYLDCGSSGAGWAFFSVYVRGT